MENQATKAKVYAILERELKKYAWAQDAERLAKAMLAVRQTLDGSRACTLTESWSVAWKEIGMKGKVSYKGLHALPAGQ